MKRLTALALAIALLAPVPGVLSSTLHATSPRNQSVDVMRSYASNLRIGSTVKVRLKAGERLKGILMAVDADSIIVKPKKRIPEPERRLPMGEIDTLEMERHGGGIGKAIAIGIATGAGTFLGLMLITIAAYND